VKALAHSLPDFAIGTFSSEMLFLGVIIHVLLFMFLGAAFWIRAFTFAAQLALVLVFFGLAMNAMFEIVVLAIHKLGLDPFGLTELYLALDEGRGPSFAVSTLQQPLFVSIVLPSALGALRGIQNLIDSAHLENVAISRLTRGKGVFLLLLFFFSRSFNHVSYFVVPMTRQVLREERFEHELRTELRRALEHIVFPEAVLSSVTKIFNRLWRAVCGSLMLAIEYVPMWSCQVVNLMMPELRHEPD
jgi:hypothetical protein